MKKRWSLSFLFLSLIILLTGCDSSLLVLDPKGPVAKTQSDTIIFSMFIMAGVLLVVYILYIYMLTKYRASKAAPGYEPPHMEGSTWLEITWTLIPVIIVIVLSVVTVRSTNAVETTRRVMRIRSRLSSMLPPRTGNGISAIRRKASRRSTTSTFRRTGQSNSGSIRTGRLQASGFRSSAARSTP